MIWEEAVLIVNTRSRTGQEDFERVRELFEKHGCLPRDCIALKRPAELMHHVEKAIEQGCKFLIVGGGDGTLSAAAGALLHKDVVLGVLPLGTGNAFARDLGLSGDLEEAVLAIVQRGTKKVDVGTANGKVFLNVATVGLTSKIAGNLDDASKKRWGKLAYLVALYKAVLTQRPFRATLETDEGTETFDTLQVVIGNGRHHAGPFLIAPEARLTSGKLAIYAVRGRNKGALLKFGWGLLWGRHTALDEVFSAASQTAHLVTNPPRSLTVDGELYGKTPVQFSIQPGALQVCVVKNITKSI